MTASRLLTPVARLLLTLQALLILTGGAVRVTGSGLGCPTWPECTGDSFTPVKGQLEGTLHSWIEFGNRLLTFVLLFVCLAQLVVLWTLRTTRRDLWWMAIALVAGIPIQAVIGGISVWMKLNPYVVGLHFVASAAMVVLATLLLLRLDDSTSLPRLRDVASLPWAIAATTTVVLLVGVLTTGSGPHAGDADAPRNGLDSELLQHVHAWPAYITVALVVIAYARGLRIEKRAWLTVLAGFGAQITLGIWQSRTGLPVELVAIHLVLSMVVTTFVTRAVYRSTTSGSSATATKSTVK